MTLQEIWNGPLPPPEVRTGDQMRAVLADPACAAEHPLYFMYRDVARNDADREWLLGCDLRFDITVIPPATLCGEYVKTKGHYHPASPEGPAYPELYQVLAGTAHYLLQDRDLADAVVIRAAGGDAVLIPPGYGHVTINPGGGDLVMANLVSTRFASEYAFFEEHRGAAYYEFEGGEWVKNPHSPRHPPLRFVDPVEIPALCIRHGRPIYDLIGRYACLAYLNAPAEAMESLAYL
ncbi:MAG TPA: glucose-6-phosphate isomerase [Methanoculleus sp.]|nr:glucose-6-phosphate isomerase [Methanoculleus sp.]